MGKVSCIIPFYNDASTVARAIDSVIHSAFCLEVVVVVDASPEPLLPCFTRQHLDLLGGKLRIVELATNQGQASARNIGAALSLGSYLSFLDADDVYLSGYYDAVVPYLEATPGVAALEVGAECVQDGQIIIDHPDPRYHAAMHSSPCNVIVRRGAFWSCGAFPVGSAFRTLAGGEDIVFKTALKRWFSVLTAAEKYVRFYSREGSALDKFLKRTTVIDGEINFNTVYETEGDGSTARAVEAHLARAAEALQAQSKLDLIRPE